MAVDKAMGLAVVSRDRKRGEELASHFEEVGYATGYLPSTAGLPDRVEEGYVQVIVLDDPDTATWDACLGGKGTRRGRTPVPCRARRPRSLDRYRDAGAEVALAKGSSMAEIDAAMDEVIT